MDALRDQRGLPRLEDLARDLRHGFRALRRAPAFTAAAVPTLALAIGASTAMFAVLNAVLLRPLPYPSADRLVMIWTDGPAEGVTQGRTAFGDLDDWRRGSRALDAIAFFDPASATLTLDGTAEHVRVGYVSPNLFTFMGAPVIRGRGFTEAEAAARRTVVMVSDRFWRDRLAAAPDVVGAAIDIDGRQVTITGVLAPEVGLWSLDEDADSWLPYTAASEWDAQREARGPGSWFVVARLAPGATVETARADLAATGSIGEPAGASPSTRVVRVQPLYQYVTGSRSRLTLWLLAGAVLVVLLLAAANVAGLTLARNAGRAREFGVRVALGASRLELPARCSPRACASRPCRACSPWGSPRRLCASCAHSRRIACRRCATSASSRASSAPRPRSASALHCSPVSRRRLRPFAGMDGRWRRRRPERGRRTIGAASARGARPRRVRARHRAARGRRAVCAQLWAAEHVSLGVDADRVLTVQLSRPDAPDEAARASPEPRRVLLRRVVRRPSPGLTRVTSRGRRPSA